MKRRVFCLLLVLLMVVTVLPVEAGAENDVQAVSMDLDQTHDTVNISVKFVFEQDNTKILVYFFNSMNEKIVVSPNRDNIYLLSPGKYYFDADCVGYELAENVSFQVSEETQQQQIYVSLMPKYNNYEENEVWAAAVPPAKTLPMLTGDQAVDTANIAASQIGYNGSSGTIYGQWWNTVTNWGVDYTYSAWCAMFACWCANQAGAGLNKAYNNMCANEENLFNWLKSNASYDDSYTTNPRAGDFVFFNGHVAIVTGYDTGTRKITFVGGNQGNAVTQGTVTWAKDSYWGTQYVRGYGRPKYTISNKFTLTFNPNGGTCSTSSKGYTKNTAATNLPTPTLSGYSFVGWYTEPFGGTQFNEGTTISENKTLYAHWSHVGSKLTFDAQGGNLSSETISHKLDGYDIDRAKGYLVVYRNRAANSNQFGMEVSVDATGRVVDYRPYDNTTQLTKPQGGFILSGHCDDGGLFVGSIHTGGYQYVGVDYATGTVTAYKDYASYLAGTKYAVGDSYGELPVVSKPGVVFGGWYKSAALNDRAYYYTAPSSSYLYAKWDAPSSLTVAAERTYNNRVYQRFDYNVSWTEAKALCESMGGHLVTITDEAEQNEVVALLSGCPLGVYYIGATDAEVEGTWKWVTGEIFSYNNWDVTGGTEPNGGTNENYSSIMGMDYAPNKVVGEWVDSPDAEFNSFYTISNCGFICEFEVPPCEHSYTLSDMILSGGRNQNPTFTESGHFTYRCQLCGEEITEYYPPFNSTDYQIEHDTIPTCTSRGKDLYTYKGNDALHIQFNVDVPKIEHDYSIVTENPATCDSYASITYTCSMCGDSYTVVTEDDLSEWVEAKPADVADEHIETKTQYRYRDKETTTGSTNTMDGWTLEGTSTSWSDYGAWSGWSTTAASASDSRQVETTTLYRYYYYYCPECGRHEPFTGTSDCGKYTLSGDNWHETWSTVPYSKSSHKTFSYTEAKYYTTSLGDGQTWCFSAGNLNNTAVGTKDNDGSGSSDVVIKTGYRFRDRSQVTTYTFYRWSDWSAWSDTAYTASDNRQVETRTVYRYHTRPLGEHEWGEWTVTTPATVEQEGVETRTCAKCGETETRSIPKISQFMVTYNANGGAPSPASQIKTAGKALTLTKDTPVRSGYAFVGWASSKNAKTAEYLPGSSFTRDVNTTLYAVWAAPDFVLPAGLTSVEAEAFEGNAFVYVKLSEETETIGSRAFGDCPNLRYIYIPEATTTIAKDAFYGATDLTIFGVEGSYAEFFAQRNGFAFIADR